MRRARGAGGGRGERSRKAPRRRPLERPERISGRRPPAGRARCSRSLSAGRPDGLRGRGGRPGRWSRRRHGAGRRGRPRPSRRQPTRPERLQGRRGRAPGSSRERSRALRRTLGIPLSPSRWPRRADCGSRAAPWIPWGSWPARPAGSPTAPPAFGSPPPTGRRAGAAGRAFNELLARLGSPSHRAALHGRRLPRAAHPRFHRADRDRGDPGPGDAAAKRSTASLSASWPEQARRLSRIVEDMLTLARADAGGLPLEAALLPGRAPGRVREGSRGARGAQGSGGPWAGPAGSRAGGDERLLRQMLMNLLDNAIRHTSAGGRVRARRVGRAVAESPSPTAARVRRADASGSSSGSFVSTLRAAGGGGRSRPAHRARHRGGSRREPRPRSERRLREHLPRPSPPRSRGASPDRHPPLV